MRQANNNIIPPDIYTKKYYLNDNEGHEKYLDLDNNIHYKFERALRLANIQERGNVLAAGCGRGELVYYALNKGTTMPWRSTFRRRPLTLPGKRL